MIQQIFPSTFNCCCGFLFARFSFSFYSGLDRCECLGPGQACNWITEYLAKKIKSGKEKHSEAENSNECEDKSRPDRVALSPRQVSRWDFALKLILTGREQILTARQVAGRLAIEFANPGKYQAAVRVCNCCITDYSSAQFVRLTLYKSIVETA